MATITLPNEILIQIAQHACEQHLCSKYGKPNSNQLRSFSYASRLFRHEARKRLFRDICLAGDLARMEVDISFLINNQIASLIQKLKLLLNDVLLTVRFRSGDGSAKPTKALVKRVCEKFKELLLLSNDSMATVEIMVTPRIQPYQASFVHLLEGFHESLRNALSTDHFRNLRCLVFWNQDLRYTTPAWEIANDTLAQNFANLTKFEYFGGGRGGHNGSSISSIRSFEKFASASLTSLRELELCTISSNDRPAACPRLPSTELHIGKIHFNTLVKLELSHVFIGDRLSTLFFKSGETSSMPHIFLKSVYIHSGEDRWENIFCALMGISRRISYLHMENLRYYDDVGRTCCSCLYNPFTQDHHALQKLYEEYYSKMVEQERFEEVKMEFERCRFSNH